MSKLSGGASYLTKESVPAKRLSTPKKSPVMVAVSAFFALLFLFMSAQPLMASFSSEPSHKVEAAGFEFLCTSKLGLGMDDKSDWSQFIKVYPLPNERNRVWTLQEAFGKGVQFTNYEGEGKGPEDQLVIDKSPANTFKPGNYDAVSEKLDGIRDMSSCFTASGLTFLANALIADANIISTIVQTFVVFSFDSNIICDDPANPSSDCLNLLKAIGGTESDGNGGLIGTLTSSIYMPLLVIAVTITAFWIGYKGLVQRKLREAMFGAIWVCLSVIFGLALLLNPSLLAKAPMAVSNSVASCVIGSFNGQNCMDGSSGTTALTTDNFSTSSDQICRSFAPGAALDEQMSMTVNSLTCSIWKAFVLEPYAQGSFGTSFESLDTIADTPTKKVIEKAGIDPNTFCVNLSSSDSLASFSGKRAVFDQDTGKVCNILAYQMFLQTNASTTGSVTPESDKIDPRWYNVVVTAANDEGLWAQWAPSGTNSLHKISTGLLATVTSLVGGIVLVSIAFFALVYYLTSVILMAFAPLFFLMGTHPGRGKKIMLGWLEKVVSNILKYLASAIFLIVSVTFYSAILGSATNPALTFLFVIIISGALFMYRKEIVELIGKASMGGEQLSSKFTDSLKDRAAGVGGLALAGIGSGVGAKIAGGRVSSGIKAGIQRDLQRGGAKKVFGNVGGELVSNATRQFARNTVDNERDVKLEAQRAQSQAAAAAEELSIVSEDHVSVVGKIEGLDASFYENTNSLEDLNNRKNALSELEVQAAREMMEENPFFAQAQLITNQIAALEFDKKVALAAGDTATADIKTAEMQQLSAQRELLLNQVDTDELAQNRADYAARVEDLRFRSNVMYTDEDEKSRVNLTNSVGEAQTVRDSLVERANELTEKRNNLEKEALGHEAKEKTLNELGQKIQPGDMVTKSKADKMIAEGEKASTEASKNAPVFATMQNSNMSDVYRTQHEKMLESKRSDPGNDSGPASGPSSNPDNGPGSRGPSGGSGSSGGSDGSEWVAGTGGAAQNDGPRSAQNGASATRTLPTSPVTDSRPTESIPTQSDRRSTAGSVERGLPTQPISTPSDRNAAAPATNQSQVPSSVPETLGRVSEVTAPVVNPPAPDRAPNVPAQAVGRSGVPTQPAQSPSVPTQSAPAPTPAPAAPVREPLVPAQPVASPSVPAQPVQSPSMPRQPDRTTSVPAQPAQAPSAPVQQQSSPAPTSAPAAPVREPRVPPQPAASPRVPTQPAQAPVAQAQAPQANREEPRVSAPQPQSTSAAPPAPTREPAVPAQPNREPNSPMVRDRGNRGVPSAQEIRLPAEPQVSRVTENSPTPSVSINRAEQSDNQSGTRRGGIPRRRDPGNS